MSQHEHTVEAFRQAASTGDAASMGSLFAPDAAFFSPAVHRPYEGHEAVMHVLGAAIRVLHPLEYTDAVVSAERAVLFFSTEVGGKRVEGIDALRFDGEGRIRELVVMIRPLSALNVVVEAMAQALSAGSPG
jgi:ketosteroid isomerase-like protein